MEKLRPRRQRVLIAVALAVVVAVVVVGGLVSLTVGASSVMYSDSCSARDEAPICSEDVQHLVVLLPLAGWLVAVALSAVGAARTARTVGVIRPVRRGTGGWRFMAIGIGVLCATLALTVRIASTE